MPLLIGDVFRRNAEVVPQQVAASRGTSQLSHAELDESTEIDEGDPAELGEQHRALCKVLTNVNILGGCCGTDPRHVDAVFQACRSR